MGSSSLKHVLPALTNLSYDDLEIGEGTIASLKFMEAAFGNISDTERQKIRIDLLTYCGQDTGGMIDILRKLQGWSTNRNSKIDQLKTKVCDVTNCLVYPTT